MGRYIRSWYSWFERWKSIMLDRELILAGYVKRSTIPLSIAQQDGIFLRTMYPRTYSFSPLSSYFYFTEQVNAIFCDEHTDCIKLPWTLNDPVTGESRYTVKLANPINIQADMPGSDHTLTHAEIQAQYNVSWFTVTKNERLFKVDNDGSTDIWKVEGEKIVMNNGSFFKNVYGTAEDPLNISLSAYSKINVQIHNITDGFPLPGVGGFTTHLRSPLITIMYTPSVPPQPATVTIRVTNKQTGTPIKNAFVELLAGNVVVANGYTKDDGTVSFNNIPGGMTGISYTLDITANGFHEYSESISIKPGSNSFSYSLVPIPIPPTPSWVYWVVGGVAALGAITVIPSLVKKKEEEKIVVVR
jgi:hypothetical protein